MKVCHSLVTQKQKVAGVSFQWYGSWMSAGYFQLLMKSTSWIAWCYYQHKAICSCLLYTGSSLMLSLLDSPTTKELQASHAAVEGIVHDQVIRKRLDRKPLLAKKNTKACLTIYQKHILKLLRKYSVDWWDWSFWRVKFYITGIKLTQHFVKRTSYQQ